jgi:hypothetical protein
MTPVSPARWQRSGGDWYLPRGARLGQVFERDARVGENGDVRRGACFHQRDFSSGIATIHKAKVSKLRAVPLMSKAMAVLRWPPKSPHSLIVCHQSDGQTMDNSVMRLSILSRPSDERISGAGSCLRAIAGNIIDQSPIEVAFEQVDETGFWVGGQHYEVDCIIFSTGFEVGTSHKSRAGFTLRGRNGVTLDEHWADGVRTMHGIHIHGFPNYFYIGGLEQAARTANFAHTLTEASGLLPV